MLILFLRAELKDFKDKVSALEKEQKKQEAEQNKDLRLKSKLEDDITHAERKITNCKRQLKSYKDNPVVEKQAQLEEARLANRELMEEKKLKLVEEVEPTMKEAREQLEIIVSNIDGARAAIHQGEKRIQELERERDEIRRRSSAKENKFGPYAGEIARKIATARWIKEPVGPIGNHIDIHDSYQKYAGVIEKQLAATLHGYIVFTLEDKMKLSKSTFKYSKTIMCQPDCLVMRPKILSNVFLSCDHQEHHQQRAQHLPAGLRVGLLSQPTKFQGGVSYAIPFGTQSLED